MENMSKAKPKAQAEKKEIKKKRPKPTGEINSKKVYLTTDTILAILGFVKKWFYVLTGMTCFIVIIVIFCWGLSHGEIKNHQQVTLWSVGTLQTSLNSFIKDSGVTKIAMDNCTLTGQETNKLLKQILENVRSDGIDKAVLFSKLDTIERQGWSTIVVIIVYTAIALACAIFVGMSPKPKVNTQQTLFQNL